MKKIIPLMLSAMLVFAAAAGAEKPADKKQKKKEAVKMGIYDITVKDNKGNDVKLSEYKGKVLLIVNTATKCGFTPQYAPLQELYEKYSSRGFEILDFPCNQFMGQAPGTAEEIQAFCETRFGVKFRQFAKIDVNGKNESPLFAYLKAQTGGKNIGWNFEKFLVDSNGNVVKRYASGDDPLKAAGPDIEKLILRESK